LPTYKVHHFVQQCIPMIDPQGMHRDFVRVEFECLFSGNVKVRIRVITIAQSLVEARKKAVWRKTMTDDIDALIMSVMGVTKMSGGLFRKHVSEYYTDLHRAALLPILDNVDAYNESLAFKLWDLKHLALSSDHQMQKHYRDHASR
jgi:hypothetical protein